MTDPAPTGAALSGPDLLDLRHFAAEHAADRYPTSGALRIWDPHDPTAAHGEVHVSQDGARWCWGIDLPERRCSGRALTLRRAWTRAYRALPELTAEQWAQVTAAAPPRPHHRKGPPVTDTAARRPTCGVTTEVQPAAFRDPDQGPAYPTVFVCAREEGHGGTVHQGGPLHPRPTEYPGHPQPTVTWPVGTPDRHHDRYHGLESATGPYRVGRKCPWNIYRQLGEAPGDEDVALFDAGTADIAARVVQALNLHRVVEDRLAEAGPGKAVTVTVAVKSGSGQARSLVESDDLTAMALYTPRSDREVLLTGLVAGLRSFARERGRAGAGIHPGELLDRLPPPQPGDIDHHPEPAPEPDPVPEQEQDTTEETP